MNIKKKIALGVLAFCLFAAGTYVFYMYQSVKTVAEQIYEARKPLPSGTVSVSAEPKAKRAKIISNEERQEPFTVLVLGVDERQNDRGRSDVMIFLAVNPAKKSMLMFNIPRDTRTNIVGHGSVDKINHAYAFGGVDMSIRSVEEFLQIPVDHYIKVNMEGFSRIINSLGGVKVRNGLAFDYEGHHFPKGELHLSGEEALAYSRMRYEDPRGDLGRNERQRAILKELIDNALDISTVFKLQSILDEVGSSVKTDISFDEMKIFMSEYRTKIEGIEQEEIRGYGRKINGVWYYMVGEDEKEQIRNRLNAYMN